MFLLFLCVPKNTCYEKQNMKLNSAVCAVKEQTPGKYGKASSGGKSIKALLVLDPITLLNFIPDSNGSDSTVLLILSIFREGVTYSTKAPW